MHVRCCKICADCSVFVSFVVADLFRARKQQVIVAVLRIECNKQQLDLGGGGGNGGHRGIQTFLNGGPGKTKLKKRRGKKHP